MDDRHVSYITKLKKKPWLSVPLPKSSPPTSMDISPNPPREHVHGNENNKINQNNRKWRINNARAVINEWIWILMSAWWYTGNSLSLSLSISLSAFLNPAGLACPGCLPSTGLVIKFQMETKSVKSTIDTGSNTLPSSPHVDFTVQRSGVGSSSSTQSRRRLSGGQWAGRSGKRRTPSGRGVIFLPNSKAAGVM